MQWRGNTVLKKEKMGEEREGEEEGKGKKEGETKANIRVKAKAKEGKEISRWLVDLREE